MTFHINSNPAVGEIAELANFAKNTSYADRIDKLSVSRFKFAEDRRRNAFMFETGPVSRDTVGQGHYLLYFMHRWFDIRSKTFWAVEVSFHDFPLEMETNRKWVEQCFGQAARIYGWDDPSPGDNRLFNPVFCPDDWRPSPL